MGRAIAPCRRIGVRTALPAPAGGGKGFYRSAASVALAYLDRLLARRVVAEYARHRVGTAYLRMNMSVQ
jgi:hypothetical protein